MGGSFFAWFLKGSVSENWVEICWNLGCLHHRLKSAGLEVGNQRDRSQKCYLSSYQKLPEPPQDTADRDMAKSEIDGKTTISDPVLQTGSSRGSGRSFRFVPFFFGGDHMFIPWKHTTPNSCPKGFQLFFRGYPEAQCRKIPCISYMFFPGKYGNFFTEPWLWKKESWKIPPFSACLRYLGIVLGEICLIHQDPKMLDGDCFCMFLSGGFSLFRSIRAVMWPYGRSQSSSSARDLPLTFQNISALQFGCQKHGVVFFFWGGKNPSRICNDVILPIIF